MEREGERDLCDMVQINVLKLLLIFCPSLSLLHYPFISSPSRLDRSLSCPSLVVDFWWLCVNDLFFLVVVVCGLSSMWKIGRAHV